ncbi:MAG: twin-arginine translocation signal domain-containing protein, partial [Nitrospirota bacterium]|nr:twin-arginine translocation signal domain-containing protein [Nitrospirota bacterium]
MGRSCVLGFQRSTEEVFSMFLSRRQFLKVSAGTVAAVAVADKALALTALQPVIEVGNPLGEYPDRSWERV